MGQEITKEKALGFKHFRLKDLWDPFLRACQLFSIEKRDMFFVQCCYESGYFRTNEENLNYKTPERLRAVFGKYFPTLADAKPFVEQPEKLANLVYGGRMGNVDPGDGWKYRGRGFIQLTGRNNYKACGKALGLDLENEPQFLLHAENSFYAAGFYWVQHKIDKCESLMESTRIINGGLNGLDERVDIGLKLTR